MEFSFIVNASVERIEGKFSTREDIEAQLLEAIEGANPGNITGENDGEYEVADWSVEENVQEKKGKKPRAVTPASSPGLPPNIVNIIREYVMLEADHDKSDIDGLFQQLDVLCSRFPKITEQERAKITQN